MKIDQRRYYSRNYHLLYLTYPSSAGKDIIGWDWHMLQSCPHNQTPEGKFYRCGNSSARNISEIYCMTGNPQNGHLYAAGSEGIIYCYDIETGQELHTYVGHGSFIHSLYYQASTSFLYSCDESLTICVWGEKYYYSFHLSFCRYPRTKWQLITLNIPKKRNEYRCHSYLSCLV